MTFLTLATRCMKKIGALQQQETPTSEETEDIRQTANNMLGSWNVDKLLLYADRIDQLNFPSSAQSYTIGPGGDLNTDTISSYRPVRITRANIVLTSQSPALYLPVTLMDSYEWLGIPVPGISTSIPIRAYYDQQWSSTPTAPTATAGLGKIYFNPYPLAPLPAFQWTSRQQLSDFSSDLTLDYLFPPGYQKAIEYSLCEELFEFAPSGVDLSPISRQAAKARAAIAGMNTQPPRITPDLGLDFGRGVRSNWNWLNGNFE